MAIELRHLRYVVAVADAGQLSRAAVRLHVAQPALSQSILRLERELGATLFDRHPRGVTATPAGVAFVEHARTAIAASDAAITAARQQGRAETDQLVLGFIGAVTTVDSLVERFTEVYPHIDLVVREVSFADQIEWLRYGTLDAAVLCPGPPFPEFVSIPIARPSVAVFVAERHRLASRSELRFEEVADETYLAQAPGLPDWWSDVWWLTARRGRRPKVGRHSSSTVNESLAGVLSGEVIVIAPDFFIPPFPIAGVRAIPLVDVDAPTVDLVHVRKNPTPATRQLAEVAHSLQV